MTRAQLDPVTERAILEAALRAPSAHNAQPWKLRRISAGRFLLWYPFEDKLLSDPDDRDGIMATGAFYETLLLAAEHRGWTATLNLSFERRDRGIEIGEFEFSPLSRAKDPLAAAIDKRQANRDSYEARPLPAELSRQLTDLGNLLLDPLKVAPLVSQASVMAWKDPRFVEDLEQWTRFDEVSPDGMTTDCLDLSWLDQRALKFALNRGRLPGWLAKIYAERDVRLTRSSGAMAVLTTAGRSQPVLFECGRRLLRSWTAINAAGYSWHPMSIVIDQATVKDLSAMIEGKDGVAIYRVGYTANPAPWSKRRALSSVLGDK